MAKVSIIVPVYKAEKYIEQCIQSLMNQTFQDIEIILVDDGSPDQCPEICDNFASQNTKIKVIHKKNAGVSAARNDGLALASGEYVIFCDPDDWMENDSIDVLYKCAFENNADVVIADVFQVKGVMKKQTVFFANEFVTEDPEFISELIKADIYRTYCPIPAEEGPAFGYGGPWNKLVRRSLLLDNGIKFDLRLQGIFDDILYTAYILAAAKTVAYINIPVYNYRILSDSLTHTFKPNVIEVNSAIFQSWNEFFAAQNNSECYLLPFYACVMRRLEESMNVYFLNNKNTKPPQKLRDELKGLSRSEPYYTAFRKVEFKKISQKQKLLAVLGRANIINAIFIIPWK